MLGVLYAMEKEAAGVLKRLEPRPLESAAGVSFFDLGRGNVLAVGGVGKVNSAMACQLLIDRFHVDAVLNPGCAGAFSALPAGTLVWGERCVQHDVDTSLAGDEPGLVSTVNVTEFPCASLPCPVPGVRSGVIATGDWFARDYDRAQAIQARFGAAVCDMEAGAAAQVCLRNGVAFMALKAVSDHLFAPAQDVEYQQNFQRAMEALDAAVATILEG